jgi:hypothetical protein
MKKPAASCDTAGMRAGYVYAQGAIEALSVTNATAQSWISFSLSSSALTLA